MLSNSTNWIFSLFFFMFRTMKKNMPRHFSIKLYNSIHFVYLSCFVQALLQTSQPSNLFQLCLTSPVFVPFQNLPRSYSPKNNNQSHLFFLIKLFPRANLKSGFLYIKRKAQLYKNLQYLFISKSEND